MEDKILLACSKCGIERNVLLEEAREYNRDNPFLCYDCKQKTKPIIESGQTRLAQVETLGQESNDIVSPIFNNRIVRTPPDPLDTVLSHRVNRVYTPEDYHPQTEFARRKMQEFKQRAERIDREIREEQVRISHGEGGSTIMHFIGIAIAIIIMLGIGVSILSTAPQSVTCSTLPGNAGKHETTKNATGWALQCENNNTMISSETTLILVVPIIISAVAVLFVIRLL